MIRRGSDCAPERSSRSGFSLIEALVALTIAALVLGALFELQIQMVRGQQRAAEAMAQVAAQENALALTRDLNPLQQPAGEIVLPEGGTVRWTSRAKTRSGTNSGFPTGPGQFQVQLFTVTVEVVRENGRPTPPLQFDRLGWRRQSPGGGGDGT
ncbi:type IV pilus modification PilV family protein [Brevundimonas sp. VNH65]|uniref:type IV pilus modification PilV family protein n=1 Tax=Brevundimonas sp. VNH65 TaxID=3400917 RepID=UPI003BFBC6BC